MSDLISKRFIQDALIEKISNLNAEGATQTARELIRLKKFVDGLTLPASAEAVQGWIPCSERLPDAEYGEGDSMLCCTESGLMYILYWNGGNWCASTGEPYHGVNHKTGWHDKVIAWMPRSC